MAYPNVERWSALQDGCRIPAGENGKFYVLSVVDCGELVLPTGQLLACDPFAFMRSNGNPCMAVPPGRYRVIVTLADVSGAGDGSHMREAYATLLLDEAAEEASRRIVTPLYEGQCPPEMTVDGEYHGFPVDAGHGAASSTAGRSPPECPGTIGSKRSSKTIRPDCWFERMDDPRHIRAGLANVPLPLAQAGENIVIIHSGWGDGHFPVVGGYDSAGRLVRVHIDFMVV